MKEIKLNKGFITFVDDDDYERLSRFKWYANVQKNGRVYATRNVKRGLPQIRMHREIMGVVDPDIDVDHWDHDGLRNLKSNLRITTRSRNTANSRLSVANTSGFKGVCWHQKAGKWSAKIGVDRKNINLGIFLSKIAAAKAYDSAAIRFFGEFALTNKMMGLYA